MLGLRWDLPLWPHVSVPSCGCAFEDKTAQPCATAAPLTSVQLGQGRVWLEWPSAVPETQTRTSGFPRTCLRLRDPRAVCRISPAVSGLVGKVPCCASVAEVTLLTVRELLV